jgi:hypothetical protein
MWGIEQSCLSPSIWSITSITVRNWIGGYVSKGKGHRDEAREAKGSCFFILRDKGSQEMHNTGAKLGKSS